MEREVYRGISDGLYVPSEFFKFMRHYEKRKEARVIEERVNAADKSKLKVYHLERHNVTLRYASAFSHIAEDNVVVTLLGNHRGVSDVEDIIATEIARRELKDAKGRKLLNRYIAGSNKMYDRLQRPSRKPVETKTTV